MSHATAPGAAHDLAGPDPGAVVRSGPLSWVQRWHWYEHTIPESRRVNPTPLADHCAVPPSATVEDVQAALVSLVARHEALRTTIDPLRPVQYVHRAEAMPPPVEYVDLPGVDLPTVLEATAALAEQPIDPVRCAPWFVRVLTEGGKPRAALVVAHHLVSDGWGLAVLIDQLSALLHGAAAPPSPPVHPLDMLGDERPSRSRAAETEWVARYVGNPGAVLAPFGGSGDGSGRHRVQHRSVRAHADLERVARRHRVSPETVGLAALAHDVAARTGEHRFLASVVVSNRARAVLRNSIGVRALTAPVQVDLTPGAPFAETLTRLAAASATGYRHGWYDPVPVAAEQARTDRYRGAVAVPTIEYNCYSWPRSYPVPEQPPPPGEDEAWIRSTPDHSCDTLYVDLARDAGVVTLDVTVGDHLLDAEDALALPARWCALLHAAAEGDECTVPDRALAPPAPGWWRGDRGWADLAAVARVLRGHPGVRDVEVTPAGGGPHLLARADVAPGVTAEDLHAHVLDHLAEVPGLVTPDRYLLAAPGTPASEATVRTVAGLPHRPPSTPAERALADAVSAVRPDPAPHGGAGDQGGVDMNRCAADHGVDLLAIPSLLRLLDAAGLAGIAPDDLAGTASLGGLAAALAPVPFRAHRGGAPTP